MSRILIPFLILIFLISNCLLISQAKPESLKNLPKTKDTVTKNGDDKIQNEDKSKTDSDGKGKKVSNNENDQDDENPNEVYKLIAIYLINKQPRALIKNAEKPEDGPKEYQIGEYIDDLQKYSISKISFNPTARVEIIDKDGLAYLIKAQNTDDKNSIAKAKSTFVGMSSPTYFSGSSSKNKGKKSFTTQESSQEAVQPPPPSGTETKPAGETTPPQQAQQASQPVQPQQGQQAQQPQQPPSQSPPPLGQATQGTASSQGAVQIGGSAPTPPKTDKPPPSGDGLDVSRPPSPF